MYAHYPKELPDLEVYYDMTAEDPGNEPSVEFSDIEICGTSVSIELYHHFISTFGEKWEREILNTLASIRRRTAA